MGWVCSLHTHLIKMYEVGIPIKYPPYCFIRGGYKMSIPNLCKNSNVLQIARRMGGYKSVLHGGVAPILELAIPMVDRNKFKMFALRLLEGPPIEESLVHTMTMILLLRHKDVQLLYPNHRLVVAITTTATELSISDEKLDRWIVSIDKSWHEVNESSLSMAQVTESACMILCFSMRWV